MGTVKNYNIFGILYVSYVRIVKMESYIYLKSNQLAIYYIFLIPTNLLKLNLVETGNNLVENEYAEANKNANGLDFLKNTSDIH